MKFQLLAIFLLGIFCAPGQAATTSLTGTVTTPDGEPIAGALVTLWNQAGNRKETVYSNSEGKYHLATGFTGDVRLRGRAPYYGDINLPLSLIEGSTADKNITLKRLITAQEISDSLPASAHASTLPFPDKKTKRAFISQCNYCHQQGNLLTRIPRSPEAWSDAIWRMEGYGAYITYGEHKQIRNLLTEGFNGSPVSVVQTSYFTPEMAKARIEEWHVAGPMSFLHDSIVGHDDKLYGLDEGDDKLYILDRESGVMEEYDMPVTDELIGGNFRGVQLPIGIFTGRHGPHSAAQISDGRIYITAALSSNLLMFHPETKNWEMYPIPRGFLWRKGLYSHTIREDHDDNLWFTVMASNMVLKFDPRTESFTEIKLPYNGFLRWLTDNFMGLILKVASFFEDSNYHLALSHHKWLNGGRDIFNWPYGIDINPIDGSVWYGKLLADKIGRIDPISLEIVEYDTPYAGPRRMRFGADGILWIPSFDEGVLMRFDPKTEQYENIPLPVLSENEYEVPYALAIHPITGDVWIAANNSDRVLRYLPQQKRFITYPMPSKVVWFRDFDFTQDGKVCTSNANLPAYAHEDGVPAFFCIDADA